MLIIAFNNLVISQELPKHLQVLRQGSIIPENVTWNNGWGINVKVDAYARYEYQKGKKVLLINNNSDLNPDDLRNYFLESMLVKLLGQSGYIFTDKVADADVCIFYQFDITDNVTVTKRQEPLWGRSTSTSISPTFHGNIMSGNFHTHLNPTFSQTNSVIGYNEVTDTKIDYTNTIKSSGMAVISLLFSEVRTCPKVKLLRLAQALTI